MAWIQSVASALNTISIFPSQMDTSKRLSTAKQNQNKTVTFPRTEGTSQDHVKDSRLKNLKNSKVNHSTDAGRRASMEATMLPNKWSNHGPYCMHKNILLT
jgi:hypothetical protein